VMMNLRDLPESACSRSPLRLSSLTVPAYAACVEAYFTNARLLSSSATCAWVRKRDGMGPT